MATYYIEYDSGESGDGTLDDPFHVDSTTDLDDILDGTYTNSTEAVSGDEYVFLDGNYGSVFINNADKNGVLFAALNDSQAIFTVFPGKYHSGGSADYECNGLFIDHYHGGSNINRYNNKLTLKGGRVHLEGSNRIGYNGNFLECHWKQLELYIKNTYTEWFRNPGGAQTFDNCSIILDTSYGGPRFAHTLSPTFRDCIISSQDSEVTLSHSSSFGSTTSNNWVHNCTGTLPDNIGTADPIFEDPANLKFRLNMVNSPCIGRGLGSWL